MSSAQAPIEADAIVVGVEGSGSTGAKVLCEVGLKVVGFDKGPRLRPTEHYSGDELKFVNRNYLWPDPKISPRTVREDTHSPSKLFPFSPCPQIVKSGINHWAGWLPRPRESDFMQRSIHGDLLGASRADWPTRYEHLEPYLTKVEWGSGCAGIAGGDQSEGFRSPPGPSEPFPPTRFGKQFYEACKTLGINSFLLPHAFVTNHHKGRNQPRQNWTGFWNRYGDPGTTRSSALFSYAMKIGVILHDMSVESNTVDLDPAVQDEWGLPSARIAPKPHPRNLAMTPTAAVADHERAAISTNVMPTAIRRTNTDWTSTFSMFPQVRE